MSIIWLFFSLFLLLVLIKLIKKEAIFIPLPLATIRTMLKLAKIKKGDILYDLGCGTGKVIITAAKEHGIKTVGIEKNKFFARLCKKNVEKNNLQRKVKVIEDDFFNQNLGKANVVILYLSQKLNDELKTKLEKELKKGTRVVSADHIFKGWKEIKKVKTGHFYTHLYKI